ncbi:MAG: hypothetical protein EOO01_17215 [Chitinophagaceae bacterium]|nr:MAG: hypothetical protein EOO01_17215 [Chitinophagaceae bacterium]
MIAIYIMAIFFRSLFEMGQTEFFRWHMIFCFCFGIYIAINKINTRTKLSFWPQVVAVVLPLLMCAYIEYVEIFDPVFKKTELIRLLSIVTNALMSFAVWSLYDYIDDRKPFRSSRWFSYSFLIYALHGVLIQMFSNAIVALLKPGPIVSLVLYFATALAMIWGCLYFGYYLKKFAPKTYNFVTGSR